jgi:uncharacterized protein YbjT (DUF2867 family)
MMDERELIAVIGATGLLGRPVVEQLLDDDFAVRVLSRDPVYAKQLMGMRPEYCFADVTDYDSLLHAFEGCEAVHVNLSSDEDSTPEDVLHQGLINIANAAKECGLKKISFISGDWQPDLNHPWERRAAFSKGILALEAGEVPTANWCCTWFFESLDYFVMPERALMVGEQPLTWHFAAASDYAKMVSAVMQDYDFAGHKRYTVHGPQGYKMFDALKRYCDKLRPGLPVEQLSIEDTKKFAQENEEDAWLEDFAGFMSWFETYGETGDPAEARELLGEPMLSLDEWIKEQTP